MIYNYWLIYRRDEIEIIEYNNVSKSMDKQVILNDISFDIYNNEIVGLIGPSGAGKTTIIKTLIGLSKVDSGSIMIFDKNVPNFKILDKLSYMPQEDGLYDNLSGMDNLKFFMSMYYSKIDKDKIIELANLVNLTADLNKIVEKYSTGMKKRLSLIVALLSNPDILVLDEPTVGIDPILRKDIWSFFNELKKQNKTLIISTHVMDEAMKCDRLLLIREGSVIEEGNPYELLEKYQVKEIEDVFLKLGDE